MGAWYEKFDPAYLEEAVAAIDAMMRDIQAHCAHPLFAGENTVVTLAKLSQRA